MSSSSAKNSHPGPRSGEGAYRHDPYFIEAAARILDVLELVSQKGELRLTDVTTELHLIKSTAFRLLHTLERKGYIERLAGGKTWRRKRRYKLGFISISASIPFVSEIERGIEAEAGSAGLDLILRRHEFDSAKLVSAVDEVLGAGAALLILYNPDEHLSHVVADRCANARVPIIAITFPAPGARLFGINSYRAGLSGGEGLGEHITRKWSGQLDLVVLLDIPGSSPAQQARITGMLDGLQKHVTLNWPRVVHLHTDRRQKTPEALMKEVLNQNPSARRIAVLCYNDLNALGALKGVQQVQRSDQVLILSQGGVTAVRAELRKPRSPLWGAVAHFPERFGKQLIPIAMKILQRQEVPATIYTDTVLLTRSNVDRYYPEG